jgi:hypothetical protein
MDTNERTSVETDTESANEIQSSSPNSDHHHTWVVFSTALADGWLMLQCVDCGLHGTVEDPTSDEWRQAFRAPSRPYQWLDETRIVVHPEIPAWKRYIVRTGIANKCECYSHRGVIEPHDFERFPNEATRPPINVTDADRAELLILGDFVKKRSLCSFLFEVVIKDAAEDLDVVLSPAAEEVARRVSLLDRKGMHCSPSVVARLLNEFALKPELPEGSD